MSNNLINGKDNAMNKERILLWGTGKIADETFKECLTLNQYDILGFIDNDKKKWGKTFFGIRIYSPCFLYENQEKIDRIVVLTNCFEEIKDQIISEMPGLEAIVENKYYFYKRSILKRYHGSEDGEINKVVEYLNSHPLDVFNYSFVEKYKDFDIDVYKDEKKDMFYVLHNGKKMYFSRKYKNADEVKIYYKSISIEQDSDSPHRYLSEKFDVNSGDVVLDVGAAEGNFSLDIVDRAGRIYIFEADHLWAEALRQTFETYKDKVSIIEKYVTSYDEGDFVKIDSVIKEDVNFIKMDIEGIEWDALWGAANVIRKSSNLRIAACCYHSDFDQVLIEDFFDKNGFNYVPSSGFMWFPFTCRQMTVSTRLNRGMVKAIKS